MLHQYSHYSLHRVNFSAIFWEKNAVAVLEPQPASPTTMICILIFLSPHYWFNVFFFVLGLSELMDRRASILHQWRTGQYHNLAFSLSLFFLVANVGRSPGRARNPDRQIDNPVDLKREPFLRSDLENLGRTGISKTKKSRTLN